MASKHAAPRDRKAAPEPTALMTTPEVGKAIVIGAVQGVGRRAGGGVVTLLLWWVRNIL